MTRRPVTVTQQVVTATPDYDTLVRNAGMISAINRPVKGGRGAMPYDRGHPTRSFTGPVPAAQDVAAAHARIQHLPDAIPYMPPDMHDAPIPAEALGSLAVIHFNRMINS